MASKIKGITIELDGNTSKFQKSLNEANKAVRNTQKELRDVNKLLKYDPKNVDLLKQKQELLNKAVADAKKKLDTEKAGLEALGKETATKEVTDQMERLKTQIAADEEALAKAKKELKDFGDVGKQQAQAVNKEFEETGKKLQEVGGKISDVGQGMTTHVTAPIVAAGGAALAAFNEVDAGYDTVIQKTGAAGDAAEAMFDIVDNIATSIPTDFATAGEAVGEVNTRFGLTGDALEDLSSQFVKFAELNGVEVTDAVDSVQKSLEAFGLGAEDAGAYLDALNKAAQDSGIGVDKLTQLTVNNATALSEMGLSIEDSTALMAQLEKSGVPVETVMGGLSKALKSATDDGIPLNEALADLQETIANSEDDTEGLAAAYELFGKQGDKVFKAVKDGALDFESLSGAAADSAGSVSETFENTLDPIDQWKLTLNELKLTGAELGATIGQVLAPMLKQLAQVVSDLRDKWEALSPEQQNMIVQIAGVIAVVGPVVAIIGSIVSGIGGLIASIGAVAGVLGVAASTVGIVIVAITAIVAAIVLLITHWDQVKAKVEEAKTAITESVSVLKDNVKQKFDEMKSNVTQKVDSIKADMSSKWNQIKSDTVNKAQSMKNDVVNKYIDLKNSAVEKVTDLKAQTQEKLESMKSDFKSKIDQIKSDTVGKFSDMKSEAVSKLTDLKSSATEKLNDLKDKFKEKLDAIKGFFSNLSLKFPKIEMPALPHFSLSGEFSLNPPSVPHLDVDWYAKAMGTPYLFTKPTVVQTPYGAIGGGEAGNELMYGHKALMDDITTASAANNDALINGMYAAMSAALKNANLKVQIGSREFGRILREAGAL